jgi:hypothetical protein
MSDQERRRPARIFGQGVFYAAGLADIEQERPFSVYIHKQETFLRILQLAIGKVTQQRIFNTI